MKNGHILCPNWLSGHRKSRFSDGLRGVFLKTQCEDGSVKSQNFEPDAERFKAKLRGFRKENTRIFIIHYKDETNLEFMTKKNKEETMDEAAENFLLLRFFELTGIDNIAKLQSFTKRCD